MKKTLRIQLKEVLSEIKGLDKADIQLIYALIVSSHNHQEQDRLLS